VKHEQLIAILADIKILDRRFIVTPAQCHPTFDEHDNGARPTYGWHLQVTYNEADVDTGKVEQQYSRKWYIADDATESDVVDTAFAAVMRSYDHVVQEHFTYKGQRVFSPHFPIETRFAMAVVNKAVTQTSAESMQREVEGVLAAFEHFLNEGLFLSVDNDLKTFDVERVAPATLVAILSITSHAKDKLKHRDAFLARAEARLVATLGAERAEALLKSRR
jgi:hypothetical protein